MSEIRERAKEWVDGWDVALVKLHGLGMGLIPEDTKECYGIISDLLAEVERMENSREAECMECEKLACIEIRQQAARECVEIIDKYPAFLFGADAVGVKLNLSQSIKAHFAIKGE